MAKDLLSVTVEEAADSVVVRATGEIDGYTVPSLQRQLDDIVLRHPNQELYIDLRDVTFIDSTGIRLLVHTNRRVRAADGTLIVQRPSSMTRKILETMGVDKTMTIQP